MIIYVERKIINWDKYFIKVEVTWRLQVLSWLVLKKVQVKLL